MIRVFFNYQQTSSQGHLPLGCPVQHVPTAAPPEHGEGRVALKRAESLGRVRNVEAQARAGAQVEEAMSGHPLPQHAARRPFTVLQHQVGAVHGDAALQWCTLQYKDTLFWKEMGWRMKKKEDELKKREENVSPKEGRMDGFV